MRSPAIRRVTSQIGKIETATLGLPLPAFLPPQPTPSNASAPAITSTDKLRMHRIVQAYFRSFHHAAALNTRAWIEITAHAVKRMVDVCA